MPAFGKRRDIVLPDPDNAKEAAAFRKEWGWDPHEQVIIRGKFTAGVQRLVSNTSTTIDQGGKIVSAMGDGGHVMLLEMIVSWTLTDDSGRVLPIDATSLEELPTEYSTPITAVIKRLSEGKSAKAQTDFLPSANGHSPASLDGANQSLMPS